MSSKSQKTARADQIVLACGCATVGIVLLVLNSVERNRRQGHELTATEFGWPRIFLSRIYLATEESKEWHTHPAKGRFQRSVYSSYVPVRRTLMWGNLLFNIGIGAWALVAVALLGQVLWHRQFSLRHLFLFALLIAVALATRWVE